MGQIRKNGIIYCDANINALGVFIDTDNVIQASAPITSSADVSYTATEDCCVFYRLISPSNGNSYVNLDGVLIYRQYANPGILSHNSYIFIKKGQTLLFHQSYSDSNGYYIVYGIQTGTSTAPKIPEYLGSMMLLDEGQTSSTTATGMYAGQKGHFGLYSGSGSISVPAGYKVKVKVSAILNSAEENLAILSINNVDLMQASTWIGNTSSVFYKHYGQTRFSDMIDLDNIQTTSRYFDGTSTGYYNFYLRSSVSGKSAFINNLTLHYYAVKI